MAGKYVDTSGAAFCDNCAAGQFAASTNQTLCSACPPGRSQPATGQSLCFACDAGEQNNPRVDKHSNWQIVLRVLQASFPILLPRYRAKTAMQDFLLLLPIKYYVWSVLLDTIAPLDNLHVTTVAPVWQNLNFFQLRKHLSSSPCLTGKYIGTLGASSCDNCAAGQFAASPNQILCSLCPPGRYQPASGQSSCIDCEAGGKRSWVQIS